MRQRFHAEPIVQATELLLQERTPRDVSVAHPRAEEVRTAPRVEDLPLPEVRRLHIRARRHAAGASAVQRPLCGDADGRRLRLQPLAGHRRHALARGRHARRLRQLRLPARRGERRVWSAGYQPTGVEPEPLRGDLHRGSRRVRAHGRAHHRRRSRSSSRPRTTPRCAAVPHQHRQPRARHRGHLLRRAGAGAARGRRGAPGLLQAVRRRPSMSPGTAPSWRRGASARPAKPDVWAAHLAVVEGEVLGSRRSKPTAPASSAAGTKCAHRSPCMDGRRLSNTVGTVLDPVFALRHRVRVPPGATVRIAFWTMVADSRERVLDLRRQAPRRERLRARRHPGLDPGAGAVAPPRHHRGRGEPVPAPRRACALRRRRAPAVLRRDPPRQRRARRACGARASPATCRSCCCGSTTSRTSRIARQLLQAHEYWRMKQLAVDLVILNERGASYVQDLQIALETLVRTSQSRAGRGTDRGGRRARQRLRAAHRPHPGGDARPALARWRGSCSWRQRGSLADQLDRRPQARCRRAARRCHAGAGRQTRRGDRPARRTLEFFNGLGGFAEDGREYVTLLGPGQSTPAPWINVIANPAFGFQVAAEGGGYTWSVNSRENQLTPWSNDPVTDRPGEAIYLRDEDTGELWGPTAVPIRDDAGAFHAARHGQGYSRFEHEAHGIALDLLQYVPLEDPVKISRLTIRNTSGRPRRLSVTAYVEWVLGPSRGRQRAVRSSPRSIRRPARCSRAIPGTATFGARVAFADLARPADGLDGGPARVPRAQRHARRTGGAARRPARSPGASAPGSIPAARCRPPVELEPGRARSEIVFLLGQAATQPRRRRWSSAIASADLDAVLRGVAGALGRGARHRAGEDAGPLDGHHAQPLAALPDAGLPHLGALGASIRRAAPTASATSCRTAWRSPSSQPGADARAPAARRRRGSSSRATSSTGGCRRPARACARASPTTGSGSPTPPRTTSRRPATPRCWTRAFRSSKARRSRPASTTPTSSPSISRRERRRSSSTARARSTRASPSARTACR